MTALDPRFITTSDLQSLFRDKSSGLPLAGGIVTFYSDLNRSVLKPVYQLSSTGGQTYAYNVLPNPCVLSMAGTFQDGLGNDIVPYYYPFMGTPVEDTGEQELYYIVIRNSGFTVQFTRQGWPQAAGSGSDNNGVLIYNYARNPQFYGWTYLPDGATGYGNVAGGFTDHLATDTADDWSYNILGDTTQVININRGVFTQGQTTVPADPVYFWQYANSNAGAGTATSNYLTQHYRSVQTLNGQTVTISFWMQSTELSFGGSSFSVYLQQYFGSGGSPHATVLTPVINLTSVGSTNWVQYTATIDVPAINNGFTLGTNNDDSLSLIFNMPLNIVVTINLANVQFVVGSNAPTFPFISNNDEYNRTDTISEYSIFRTGDVKPTLRNSADIGWLLMDDTTIGNSYSNATHTGWSLFNLYCMIWNNVNNIVWAPIYNSAGILSTYGSDAITDWNANKQLALTKVLGRALSGAGQSIIQLVITVSIGDNALVYSSGSLGASLMTGTPFKLATTGTMPTTTAGALVAGTTYYAYQVSGTEISIATTQANAVSGTLLTLNGAGTGILTLTVQGYPTWAEGQYYGENFHSVLASQLPVTSLTLNTQILNLGSTGSTFNAPQSAGATPLTGAVQSFGGSVAMNVTQPSAFFNVMIKL